jgi:2-polyprenyl-6-methoxyphenol hydroxylase-like FAD-dependent oxidoreductase
MHVAIFGAGIAGLMSAITLRLHGHSCALYERSRQAHDAGMGFILMPEAITCMEKLGIQLTGDCIGLPLDRYICRNITGKVLYEQAIAQPSRSIRRRELINALVDAANLKDALKFDAELEQLEFGDQGYVTTAVLSSGERVTADLFVAADGARSRIRHTLFPNWPVQKARVLEVVGLVRCAKATRWAGHNFNKFHASAGGLAFGVLPVDTDHIVWFMQFDSFRFLPPRTRDASSPDWQDFVLKIVGRWAFPVASLLATTESRNMHVWSPLDVDVIPCFHRENVVLTGDAAHPLSPFTSQGVSSAVADAMTLANVLPRTNDKKLLEKALAYYSDQRQRQCALYLNTGRELTQKFLAPVNRNNFMLPLAR